MEETSKNTLLHTTAARLGYLTMSLPAFGVLSTVAYSLMYDFKATTKTHCGVYNFLPSISAAIGNRPQCYLWRISIALHAAPRFMYALAYYNWHKQVHVGKSQSVYMLLVNLAVMLHVIENLMLVMLTSISSNENKDIHEWCFILFIITSWMYMLLTIHIISWASTAVTTRSNYQEFLLPIHRTIVFKILWLLSHIIIIETVDSKSYLYKKILAGINISGFIFAIYLYFRHNSHCEPYVYSFFALFEYVTIFSNIAFHGTATIDMRDYSAGVVLTDLLLKQR